MRKLSFLIITISLLILSSCKTGITQNNIQSDIPYIVAERYFLKNNVSDISEPKITTQKEFDELFGAAAVMGKNGMPTKIDFAKEFVIAVSNPTTDYSTELIPVSLRRNNDGEIVFTYKFIKGEKQSYFITPCLLIIVKNDITGKVILNEIL